MALIGGVALLQGVIHKSDRRSTSQVLLALALGTVGVGMLTWALLTWLRRRRDPDLRVATLQDVLSWRTPSKCPTCDGPVRGEHRTYANATQSEVRQVFVCAPSDGEHFEAARPPARQQT